MTNTTGNSRPQLKIKRVNLDTGRENVVVISRRSTALRPDIFRGFSRVELRSNSRTILATLLLTDDGLVAPDELGLAEPAFRRFAEPAGSLVTVTPATPPESLDSVRAKIQGHVLSAAEIGSIVDDITHYRYSDMEIAAFLIGSASFMTSGELLALSRAMADAGTQLKWEGHIVVDKHCIGGIPGNRTSMIVVPIVAAHGLMIPKTSSRAITSPAGTADTMEVLARVDLGVDAMKEVVTACHGCLVWGGHVNLSPADDILISVERPLSLDTREQMVASIMSKKLAAGSTHLLIDLPVGPSAKLTTTMEAMRLRKLFEFVGDHFGIAVEVIITDGRQPIGNIAIDLWRGGRQSNGLRDARRRMRSSPRDFGGNPPYEKMKEVARICFKHWLKQTNLLFDHRGKSEQHRHLRDLPRHGRRAARALQPERRHPPYAVYRRRRTELVRGHGRDARHLRCAASRSIFGFDSDMDEVIHYAKAANAWMKAGGREQAAAQLGITATPKAAWRGAEHGWQGRRPLPAGTSARQEFARIRGGQDAPEGRRRTPSITWGSARSRRWPREDRVSNILGGESSEVTPTGYNIGGNVVFGTSPGRRGQVLETPLGNVPVYNSEV